MTPTTATFDVVGVPKPQGSKKAFNANGKAMLKEAGGLDHAAWRNAVSDKAKAIAAEFGVFTGALRIDLEYRFAMPKSRPKWAHTVGKTWKMTAPDIDKLNRAVFDALQAASLIANDALVCDGRTRKVEVTGWTGAIITITALEQGDCV